MVDAIGKTPGIAMQGVTKVAAPTPVVPTAAEPDAPTQAASTTALGGTARQLAASPPVDLERVTRIRRAIEEGRFPLSPSTIADRLIALRMDWIAHDEA